MVYNVVVWFFEVAVQAVSAAGVASCSVDSDWSVRDLLRTSTPRSRRDSAHSVVVIGQHGADEANQRVIDSSSPEDRATESHNDWNTTTGSARTHAGLNQNL